MPQKVGTVTSELILDTRRATQEYQRFERTVNRNRGRDNFMSSISADAKDFDNSLGKATNRVVAFGAAAAVFGTISKGAYEFAKSIVEIDNSLAKINVNLGQSQAGLKKFGSDLFNIARQTGQTFEVTAKAAEELARQGLSAEETTKRLKDSLILSRIAGLDSAEAVNTLTAAINSFNEEALTSTEIVNKFAAVDTKFAVSSKDLAEAVSRVGSTAQSAGVGIDQLIGLVTSLQQTTARGGATIGNGLKTIFTRIQSAPETVSALEGIGVAIKNTDGSLRDALSILRDYGQAREKVGEVERAALDRTVAGTFQINILKAALSDLNKEYSIYGNAVRTSADATDEAIRKNEKLNETIASLLNSTGTSIKQLFANIGGEKVGPYIQLILKGFERIRAFFSGDSGSDLGKSLGDGLLQGITNVLSGPALGAITLILFQAFSKVVLTIAQEARTLLSLNSAAEARINIQKQINTLLGQATAAENAQYAAASSVLAKKEAILAIQARINQESLAGTPLTRSFQVAGGLAGTRADPRLRRGGSYLGEVPGFAANSITAAINREVAAGAPAGQVYVDRDARVASFANPMGLLVANRRDEPLGGFQGVNRVLSQGGNPRTNGIPGFAKVPNFSTADDLAKFFRLLGGAAGIAARTATAERIAKGEDVKFTKPQAIKLAKADPHYVLKENSDGSVSVIQILTSEQVAASKAALPKVSPTGPIRDRSGRFVSSTNVPAAVLRASDQGGRLIETGGLGAVEDYNAQLARRNPLPRQRPIPTPSLVGDDLINRAVNYDANYVPAMERQRLLGRVQRIAKFSKRGAETRRQALAKIEQDRQRRSDRTLGAAFIAPFIGGFAEPIAQSLGVRTGGGTPGGVVTGAISTGSQLAGFGALTGNPVIAGGAAVVGALIGALGKLKKSTEEITADLDEQIANRDKESDAISRAIQLQEELNNALKEGADQNVTDKLDQALRQVRGDIQTKGSHDVLDITNPQEQGKAAIRRQDELQRLSARDRVQALLLDSGKVNDFQGTRGGKIGGNDSLARDIKETITDEAAKGISSEQTLAIAKIAAKTFSTPTPRFIQGPNGAIGGIQNAQEFIDATDEFKKAVDTLTSVAGQAGIGVNREDIKPENLQAIALAIYKSIGEKNIDITRNDAARKTQEAARGRLTIGSFLNPPDLGIYGRAALTGRTPTANRGQRAQSTFDFYNDLKAQGGYTGSLEQNKDYTKSRVGVQEKNQTDASIEFLQKNNPGVGTLRDNLGNPLLTSIERQLSLIVGAGTSNSAKAAALLPNISRLRLTQQDQKIKVVDRALENGPNFSSGLTPGADNGTFTKSLKRGGAGYVNSANLKATLDTFGVGGEYDAKYYGSFGSVTPGNRFNTIKGLQQYNAKSAETFDLKQQATSAAAPTASQEAPKQAQINVNIDGALNLIANGMDPQLATLINTKVNQAVVDATSEYFKGVQPQLDALNAQISSINGKPLPPSSASIPRGLPVAFSDGSDD